MKIKLSLLFFLGTLLTLVAQNEDVYENWSSIEVDYGITKNIDIYGGGQLRIKSVGDSYNKSFYELGAKIKINEENEATISLASPETAVSPGQACVFYCKDEIGIRLLGGGWIHSTN